MQFGINFTLTDQSELSDFVKYTIKLTTQYIETEPWKASCKDTPLQLHAKINKRSRQMMAKNDIYFPYSFIHSFTFLQIEVKVNLLFRFSSRNAI